MKERYHISMSGHTDQEILDIATKLASNTLPISSAAGKLIESFQDSINEVLVEQGLSHRYSTNELLEFNRILDRLKSDFENVIENN